jgi:hypothetical protein
MEIPLTRRQYAVFLAVFLVIAVSSFAVASRLRFEFVREAPLNHYQLQANGIMHGKIGLCNATGDFIYIIDQSTLRPGVPQAYWGPLPTLLPLAFNNVMGVGLLDSAQVFLLSTASLYVFFFLAYLAINAIFRAVSAGAKFYFSLLGMAAVGFSSCYLHVVSYNYSWFISIASAQLFVLLHLLLIVVYTSYRKSDALLWGIGAAAAFGFMCKESFLPSFILSLSYLTVYELGGRKPRRILARMRPLWLPLIAGFALIMAWNYIRFEDPFENGFLYQNTDFPRYDSLPTVARWPCNLFNYFLAPVTLSLYLPFFEYGLRGFNGCLLHYFPFPPFFFASPLSLTLLLAPVILHLDFRAGRRSRERPVIWGLLMFSLPVWLLNIGADGSWMRFVYDVYWLLTLAVVVLLVRLYAMLGRRLRKSPLAPAAKAAFAAALILCLVWQAIVALDYVLGETLWHRFIFSFHMATETDLQNIRMIDEAVNPLIGRFVEK